MSSQLRGESSGRVLTPLERELIFVFKLENVQASSTAGERQEQDDDVVIIETPIEVIDLTSDD